MILSLFLVCCLQLISVLEAALVSTDKLENPEADISHTQTF